jgi:hypothetical protein
MRDWVLFGSLFLFLGARAASLVRFWKIPFSFGADRFFGLPVGAEAAQPLLRRYRALLVVAYLPDVILAITAFLWGGLITLFCEQLAAAVLIRLYDTLVAIHTIRQAKWLAAEASWNPVRSVSLSLKTRRLRDYSSVPFELALGLLMIGPLLLLAYQSPPFDPPRTRALAAVVIYLEFGCLLLKHALLKWRMWLPGERTEVYLAWREAVLRYFLWICDYLRAALALALVAAATFITLRGSGGGRAIVPLALALGGGLVLVGLAGLLRKQRQLSTLWQQLQPLDAFSSPPVPFDAGRFMLGGLCYCNADDPALFAPGPLVYALNLANKRAYLYSAYLAGLIMLGFWCIDVPH